MASTTSKNDEPNGEPTARMATVAPPPPGFGGSAGEALVTASIGDTCANCGAPLAADQRYCVECGERRGKARFSSMPSAASAPAEVTTLASPGLRRFSLSSGATLLAGIATLLLAMGVGVLIGHNGSTSAKNAGAPVTIVGGAGGAAASAATTAAAATAAPPARASAPKPVGKAKPATAPVNSAPKIITTVKNLPPPTVTQGSACANGTAGCQGGRFTGNFFGQ
jgi:hypothetical protein